MKKVQFQNTLETKYCKGRARKKVRSQDFAAAEIAKILPEYQPCQFIKFTDSGP
jgi:hypothetical protein